MPVGHIQFVEIAREIDKTGVKVLVFDEATAVLTESEADQLLKPSCDRRQRHCHHLYYHRLDEVMAVCDSVTILRDGEQVAANGRQTDQCGPVGRADGGPRAGYHLCRQSFNPTAKYALNKTSMCTWRAKMSRVLTFGTQGEIFGIGGPSARAKSASVMASWALLQRGSS